MANYKYILVDEWGGLLRKFASRIEATPYLTKGTTLLRLPKQPSGYELAKTLMKDALL